MLEQQPNDIELVNNIKHNNDLANYSVTTLLDRHAPLYNKIVSKMVTGQHHETIMNDKYYVLFNAATKFDETKNVKFSTWFGDCARYHTLNYLTELKSPENNNIPIDDYLTSETHQYEEQSFPDERENLVFNRLKKVSDKRIYKIFNLKYKKNKKWSEISELLGITVTMCINLRNKGREILLNEFKKEPLLEKTI
jgi:RNA polymerase sigma factor (sigma-70 family)